MTAQLRARSTAPFTKLRIKTDQDTRKDLGL